MSAWALATGPWRSSPGWALSTATGRKLTFRLDAPCVLGFRLDGRGVDARSITVLETDVWVYRDGGLLYRGRVVAAPDDLDGTEHSRDIEVTDYRGLLSRRYAMSALSFADQDQGLIAWQLIQHSQGQPGGHLGITYGTVPAGTPRDRTYAVGDNLGDRLAELGRVEAGFDWWIDANRALCLGAPRGVDTNVVLDYGGTVAAVSREPDVGAFANAVLVTAAQEVAPAIRLGGGVLSDTRGRWEDTFSFPSIIQQSTVNAKANYLLAEGQKPPVVYSMKLRPDAWPTTVNLGLGDTALVRLDSGHLSEQVRVRVIEVSVAIGDSGDEEVGMVAVATDLPLAREGAQPSHWRDDLA